MSQYRIVEGKKTKQVAVEILGEQFKGMIVRFGKVGIKECGQSAKLAFDFDVIRGTLPRDKRKFAMLENMLGDILVDILENNLGDVEFSSGNN